MRHQPAYTPKLVATPFLHPGVQPNAPPALRSGLRPSAVRWKCGDPLIELRAAKIILQTSQKALENTEIEAAADNLKETVAQQTEQIEKLEAENKSLLDYRDQFRKIVNTLVDGSFRRPDWITLRSWEKITRANESTLAAT